MFNVILLSLMGINGFSINTKKIQKEWFEKWKPSSHHLYQHSSANWTWNWAGPEGGEIMKVAGNSNVNNWVFALSMMELWESTDNGATWNPVPFFEFRFPLDAMIISDSIALVLLNQTIYRTSNRGFTWDSVHSFSNFWVMSSEVPDTIVYAVDSFPTPRVWRSTDKGLTWTVQGAIGSADSMNIVQVNHIWNSAPNMVRVIAKFENDTLSYIFGSFDAGATWSIFDTIVSDYEVRDFQNNPVNLWQSMITTERGIYQATAFAGPWNLVAEAFIDTLFQPFDIEFVGQFEILVSSFINQGMFKGVQSGGVWSFNRVENREICSGLSKSGTDFFTGTYGLGVFQSPDSGNTWFPANNGLSANILFSEGNASKIYDSSFYFINLGGVIKKTSDFGATWAQLGNFLIWGSSIDQSPLNPDFLIASAWDISFGPSGLRFLTIFRSLDGGATWSPVDSNIVASDLHILRQDSIVIAQESPNFGAPNVYRSTQMGNNFNLVLSLPSYPYPAEGLDTVFFPTWDSTYVSYDQGANWQILLDHSGNNLSYDETRKILYAGPVSEDTLYKYSIQTGQIDTITGLGSIIDHSVSPNGVFYVLSNQSGVPVIYRSIDTGVTFEIDTLPFSNGVGLVAGNNAVGVYQMGRGFYVSTDITVSAQEKPFSLGMPFFKISNLFKSQIEVKLFLPQEDYLKIDLYDVTGRKIEPLFSEKLNRGNWTLELKPSFKKAGIYFLKIEMNKRGEIVKILKF